MSITSASHPFLPDTFVADLQAQARRLSAAGKARDRRQWRFGEMVNSAWDIIPNDVKEEIPLGVFYAECSRIINASVPFPLVSASGETLRRWCEIAARFAGTPGIEAMREALSFEHFRQSVILANNGKVSVPVYALAEAIRLGLDSEDMRTHFDPPTPPDYHQRAIGWLDCLETYEWNGNKAAALPHVRALRELI